jgi:hypothetical protein
LAQRFRCFVAIDWPGKARGGTVAPFLHKPFKDAIMNTPYTARSLWAFVIIAIGCVLLASNFGLIPAVHIHQWWPVILVLVGVRALLWPRRVRHCHRDQTTG